MAKLFIHLTLLLMFCSYIGCYRKIFKKTRPTKTKFMYPHPRRIVYGNEILDPHVRFVEPHVIFFCVFEDVPWEKMEIFANIERPVYDHTVCDIRGDLIRIPVFIDEIIWYYIATHSDAELRKWVYFRLEATHTAGNLTTIHGRAPLQRKLNTFW